MIGCAKKTLFLEILITSLFNGMYRCIPHNCILSAILYFFLSLFIYLGFYVAFNTVQVISRRVVGKAEETSIYSSSGFCTVNCRPTASNYQLSHLRPCREPNPGLRDGRRVLPLCHCGPYISFLRVQ